MGYSNKTWVCPFFGWDERLCIHCEGKSSVHFFDRAGVEEYADQHCAALDGWEDCSIAQSLLRHYERKDKYEG